MRTAAINLRVQPEQRDLIDYAAHLLGKTRSDFMLEVVTAQAQNVILDRTLFQLDSENFAKFNALLESPNDNKALEKLMSIQAPWEQEKK